MKTDRAHPTPLAHARGLLSRLGGLPAAMQLLNRSLDSLRPLAALLARLHMAQVFFLSGLTKLRDWGTTLDLFAYEYQVPLLPPPVAAVMGTGAELVLPILLVLGLGGRIAALGLFVVNVVAVISLPDMPQAAFQLHVFWGSLLAGIAIYGPGRWSSDCWLKGRWPRVPG